MTEGAAVVHSGRERRLCFVWGGERARGPFLQLLR